MAKRGNSVIGIDLGKRTYKAVLLNKKSDTRYALTSFASHEVPEDVTTTDGVAQHIKLLLKDLGGFTKSCALAVSEPDALLRIIEQPATPPQLLRNVWGPNQADHAHYLRIYMGHLRHKLEDNPAQPRYMITETGVGYRFQLPAEVV